MDVSRPYRAQALWETTSRLLATIVNEGLVECPAELSLPVSPRAWRPPVFDKPDGISNVNTWSVAGFGDLDLSSEAIFESLLSRFECEPTVKDQIIAELRSSVIFQEQWLDEAALKRHATMVQGPSLKDSSADWEMAIIRGHPTHPGHRALLPQAPLRPIAAEDLPYVKEPTIIFISVLRDTITTVGPFEELMHSLTKEYLEEDFPKSYGRITLPCLERQIESIRKCLGDEVVGLSGKKPLHGRAQSSLRTVSLPTAKTFHHDLKLALACNITSALRTITPWTALIGPEVSNILDKTLAPDMWVCHEFAAATGSHSDFNIAKHCSVLIRENLESKAAARGEILIVAAALSERGVDGGVCHAERVSGLDSEGKKEAWFRQYTSKFLHCTLPPIYRHGISLEAHSQNILVRFNTETKALAGFAYRDFGGLKLHTPTLTKQGHEIKSSPPGSLILTDNMQELFGNCHHTIFQSHLNQLIQALGMSEQTAWSIVREEIKSVMAPDFEEGAKPLYDFLMQDTAPYKCFLRMKMQGLYRDYIHLDVPNVILR